MERTKEIRWFIPSTEFKPLPWFDSQDFETTREISDHYLCLVAAGMEAKCNGRQLRLKQRVGNKGTDSLTETAWGYSLNFVQWSFDLTKGDPTVREILAGKDEPWWPVAKIRRTVQLVEEGEKVKFYPEDRKFPGGCRVKHTTLTVCETRWDTLCFEFFGKDCMNLDPGLVREIIGDNEYNLKRSMGYAQFLNEMVDRNRSSLYDDDHILPRRNALDDVPINT